MPRASGSGKRQPGAAAGNHRDSRPDNGLVGPGTRVSARKSHGHLNGSARSPDLAAPAPSPPPPASAAIPPLNPKRRPDDAAVAAPATASSHSSGLDCFSGDASRRDSFGTYSEASSESCHSTMGANGNSGLVDGGHRQIDVNAMKNADVHRDSGPLELAATVVRSLPIQDTLAILIILMHIPYLSLTLVYACFASLTFVPPVASRAGWNINFGDILDSNSHTPSLATVMCMDFFFFLIWVFLWPPIQDSMLEFAKPVIAVTLGGGTSTKHGTSRGVTVCFTWVLLHKLVRASKCYWPRLGRHLPDAWRVHAVFNTALPTVTTTTTNAASAAMSAPYDKRDTHGWIQSILAIHILTQGIVRYIREWYLRRERFHAAAATGDPEAAKPSTATGGGASNTATAPPTGDSAHDTNPIAPDTEAGPPPASSHPVAMTKKKRKQSAQVRLQQPLWAALASTKIVAMKEIELSSWGSGSSDKRDIHNSGNTPSFNRQPKKIWISYIGSDEVCFSTSRFPDPDEESPQLSKASSQGTRPAGVDTSKPFYVRINNAFWQPTRIFPVDESDEGGSQGLRWTGDIYGLRPASKYVCEFVDARTDQVLFTTSIRTVKEPLRDHDALSSGLPNGQQPLRPDSPATTLRTSIAAAEAKLADEKNRLKMWRKEWKIRINTLKKENELADNQLASAGNSDEKYKQKIRQQETQKAQAERDTQRLAEQLKNCDATPELTERKKKAERAYSAEKKVFDAAQKELREHKSRLEGEVKAKEVEQSNLNTRRNKVATRIAKVENELANIADANTRGLDEVERRRQERSTWLEQMAEIEHNYVERLGQVIAANNGRREHLRSLQTQRQAMQGFLNPANGMGLDVNPAMVTETGHASFQRPNPWNPTPMAPAHYPAGLWATSSSDMHPSPRGPRARGRSSSMLSDISGFTQASDDGSRSPPAAVRHRPRPAFGRRNGASGSSGSSGGGSVGDSTSPA
ncbi:putative ubiquitination network signaling protein acrB [Hirsutella rhossiliensis]|uniref:Ubiquitination network signaling protein acrB n=1 Tax=Hirsutella rhossiliensis TaxID=111463 RepID=A0A9P8MYQ6_9HYPO|nr:putative ubiquitination network signaling protein acrB [Hirsutella rhossiliensis]KAH0963705.1 putative ubiquitination network signaling protein acrB [Hirsutella rhossiliensis]